MKTWIIKCFFLLLMISLWGCQESQEVIIHFEVNGGQEIDDIVVNHPVTNLILPTPDKEGFTFLGWYLDEALITLYALDLITNHDITLFAKWIINTYTLYFMSDDVIIGESEVIFGDYLIPTKEPTKVGYTFLGWYMNPLFTTPFVNDTMRSQDMTLYAKWEHTLYNFNFETLGGNDIDSLMLHSGDAIPLLPIPFREGYTFLGWYLNPLFITPFIFDTMRSQDVTLYAKWEINRYTITFDTNDGNVIDSLMLHSGDDIPLLPIPFREGYTFLGWYMNPLFTTPFVFDTMRSQDETLYAKWEINRYTITFDTNDGTLIEPITADFQSVLLIPEPIKIGHTFEDWYLDIEMLNPYPFEEYTMPSYNLTIYAKWVINSFTLSYYLVDFDETMPFPLFPNEVITYVALGDVYSAAITSIGRLFMWGDNTYDKLGCNQPGNQLIPVDITSHFNLAEDEQIASVILGWNHTAAITSLGRVFTWGYNRRGQLGHSFIFSNIVSIPTEFTPNFNLLPNEVIIEVSLGEQHSAALSSLGRVFTWGYNYYGQLGNGTNVGRGLPDEITSFFNLQEGETISHISLGSEHSSAITSSGRIFTWGRNHYGGVGDGTQIDRNLPTDITPRLNLQDGETVIYADLSRFHNALITSNHRLFVWTQHSFNPFDITYDIELYEDEHIVSVSLGVSYTYLFTSNHRVLELNIYSRLFVDITPMINLASEETINFLSAGSLHSSLLTSFGKIYLWGSNVSGEIGNGTIVDQIEPVELRPYLTTRIQEISIEYGTQIPFYQPTYEGYTLNAWYIDVTLMENHLFSTMLDNDIQLFGSWIENLQ